MRLRLLSESDGFVDDTSRRSSSPSLPLVSNKVESVLRNIDFASISTRHWPVVDISIGDLLVRERIVYDETVEEFMDEFRRLGGFVCPSGDTSESYYPLGVRFGDKVVVCDGTHRVEALIRLGLKSISMQVVDKWW